jgi:outer membrane protein OmpA-like peptidoglycan-associated protein
MEMAGGGVAGHKGAPFRAHLNLGFTLDRSERILRTESGDTINIGAVERFALGLSKYNTFDIAVAVEAPLKAYYFTPFVEWSLHIPLYPGKGNTDFVCLSTGFENCPQDFDLDGDNMIDANTAEVGTHGFNSWPDIITIGVRITPPIRGLTIDLSADIGLTTALVWGLAANRQYSANFGLTYTYDPVARVKTETKEIEKIVTLPPTIVAPKPPEEAKVVGVVKDAKTSAPIAGAIIAFPGKKFTALATDASGNFESYAFPYGALVMDISREGYEPSTETIKVEAGGASLSVELVPIIKKAKLSGSVRDADKGTPVGATLSFKSAAGGTTSLMASGGSIDGEIDEGAWAVDVTATGYLAKATTIAVKGGDKASMDIELRKAPLVPLAVLVKDRIIIKKQVNFATGKADILPKSFGLLDEVASIIISHPEIKRVSVEGHTDSRGADDMNMKLSDDRAHAVMKYLVGAGVDPARLDAKGFGETKPLAPNTTEKNRAKNRRVELHVEY